MRKNITASGAEVVDVIWWATETTVGIVVIKLPEHYEQGEYKAYIGSTDRLMFAGDDEARDARYIAEHGTRFHEIEALKLLFPALKDADWYKG